MDLLPLNTSCGMLNTAGVVSQDTFLSLLLHREEPARRLLFLFVFILFMPEVSVFFLKHVNSEQTDALKTPEYIAPEWILPDLQ